VNEARKKDAQKEPWKSRGSSQEIGGKGKIGKKEEKGDSDKCSPFEYSPE